MDLFERRLLAEGLRAIEGDSPNLLTTASAKPLVSFEERLLQRAVDLDPQLQITSLFAHFKGLTKNFFILLALCLLVLGASSVQQLFFTEQGTQVNFFWAFALFFIPNLLAFCLWLLLFFRQSLLSANWLARLSLFLLKALEKRFNPQAAEHPHFWVLFKCYFKVAFTGTLGRYQLSGLTHLLWFSYFCGATFTLVIMLATHQVDFVWQTSILSLSNFQWLTELLAYLPNLLGIPVPDALQIQHSNVAIMNELVDAQQSRFVWSSLLISSLLIYGIIPRFLLWLLMRFLFKIKQKHFRLTLSEPYYVQLRQQLKPNVTSLGIRDPDTSQKITAEYCHNNITSQALPERFYPIAIELSEKQFLICSKHVEQHSPEQVAVLKNICDFPAQQSLLNDFTQIKPMATVLYVSVSRLPDRGLSGFIKSLTASGKNPFYLLLIDDQQSAQAQLTKRRSDWYTLAVQVGISLDNIIHLQNNNGVGRYE